MLNDCTLHVLRVVIVLHYVANLKSVSLGQRISTGSLASASR